MKKAQDAASPPEATTAKLTPKQQRFVKEYTLDYNAAAAAARAGYSARSAEVIGFENLRKPSIAAAIAAHQAEQGAKHEATREFVLQKWMELAVADPNELTQHRRVNCRYCFGVGFEKQWVDEEEYEAACAYALAEGISVPSDAGGYGFDPNERPHPKCPHCNGEGHGMVFIGDTRHLSPGGKALYAGVKQTKFGIEIQMHDRTKALENIARHLGMFNDKLTLKGDEQNPLAVLLQSVQGATIKPVPQ